MSFNVDSMPGEAFGIVRPSNPSYFSSPLPDSREAIIASSSRGPSFPPTPAQAVTLRADAGSFGEMHRSTMLVDTPASRSWFKSSAVIFPAAFIC